MTPHRKACWCNSAKDRFVILQKQALQCCKDKIDNVTKPTDKTKRKEERTDLSIYLIKK